jgi:hypothetical protein
VIGWLAGKVPVSQQPYGSEQQSKANYDDPLDLTFLSLAHWFSTWFSDFLTSIPLMVIFLFQIRQNQSFQ